MQDPVPQTLGVNGLSIQQDHIDPRVGGVSQFRGLAIDGHPPGSEVGLGPSSGSEASRREDFLETLAAGLSDFVLLRAGSLGVASGPATRSAACGSHPFASGEGVPSESGPVGCSRWESASSGGDGGSMGDTTLGDGGTMDDTALGDAVATRELVIKLLELVG